MAWFFGVDGLCADNPRAFAFFCIDGKIYSVRGRWCTEIIKRRYLFDSPGQCRASAGAGWERHSNIYFTIMTVY